MHGINTHNINNGFKRIYRINIKSVIQVKFWDLGGTQDESIFVHLSHLVGSISSLYQVDARVILYLGVKVLAWYIDLNGIKNSNILKYLHLLVLIKKYIYLSFTLWEVIKNRNIFKYLYLLVLRNTSILVSLSEKLTQVVSRSLLQSCSSEKLCDVLSSVCCWWWSVCVMISQSLWMFLLQVEAF